MGRGSSGAATKEAIREAAIIEFRLHGYRGASLETIAAKLGITRAAVLHHYGTKTDLLAAVLNPYLDAVEHVIGRYAWRSPLTPQHRRLFLADVIDAFIAHHDVAGILIRDITAHADVKTVDRAAEMLASFTTLLTGPELPPDGRIITTAILGAILRPLTDPTVDLTDPITRTTLIRMTNALAKQIDVQPAHTETSPLPSPVTR